MGAKLLRRILPIAGAGVMLAAMTAVVPAAATPPSPLAGYASGTYTTINYPGAAQTDISGINNLGTMIGYYVDTGGLDHGFIYQHGRFTPFNDSNAGTLKGQGTLGSGINDFGTAVGVYIDSNGTYHGFIYQRGTFTTLDGPSPSMLGSFGAFANFINDFGTVTGAYTDTNNVFHGFLYHDGSYTTVDDVNGGAGLIRAQ